MKRSLIASIALSLAMLGPVACGPATEQAAPSDPDAPEGISVSDARLTLPAVSGNPGALYFTITNASDQSVMIRSAFVQGAASAVMHETATWSLEVDMQEVVQVPVPAGESVNFEPGMLHVMAMDLDDTLAVGGETEVTLTFVGGDKVSFPAQIRAPGDGEMDHSTMSGGAMDDDT